MSKKDNKIVKNLTLDKDTIDRLSYYSKQIRGDTNISYAVRHLAAKYILTPDNKENKLELVFPDPSELIKNQDTDAHRWADAFIGVIYNGVDIDRELLITWFSNAIMIGKENG